MSAAFRKLDAIYSGAGGSVVTGTPTVAEQLQTSYHATDSTSTIGIRGPDARERIDQFRRALDKLAAKHGWTFRDAPR